MSGCRRFDLFEASVWKPKHTSLFPFPFPFPFPSPMADYEMEVEEHLGFTLDLLNPNPHTLDLHFQRLLPYPTPSPLDFFESAADLVETSFFAAAARRFQERAESELYLKRLSDRVTALELGFDRATRPNIEGLDRTYKWTTEIKGQKDDGFDRKYKLVAEAKAGKERNLKWTTEFKGKGKDAPASRTFTFETSTAPAEVKAKAGKVKHEKDSKPTPRVVEIEESDPGAIVIRKAFARRVLDRSKGKRKDISPQDAAVIIQMTFRAHLVRRSQVARGLRDLAVAKAKLKEIRALFNNFSYRLRIAKDAEERQRFSEKIIVLLLTVDAIEGPDYMVRAVRRSMVEELEAMLEVVDPQPQGKLGSMKRRRFDLPAGGPMSKEMARGVSEVVRLVDQDENGSM